MLYQSDNTNTNQKQWNETEIRDLILYAKSLQQDNEDLRAKMIMMNTLYLVYYVKKCCDIHLKKSQLKHC